MLMTSLLGDEVRFCAQQLAPVTARPALALYDCSTGTRFMAYAIGWSSSTACQGAWQDDGRLNVDLDEIKVSEARAA